MSENPEYDLNVLSPTTVGRKSYPFGLRFHVVHIVGNFDFHRNLLATRGSDARPSLKEQANLNRIVPVSTRSTAFDHEIGRDNINWSIDHSQWRAVGLGLPKSISKEPKPQRVHQLQCPDLDRPTIPIVDRQNSALQVTPFEQPVGAARRPEGKGRLKITGNGSGLFPRRGCLPARVPSRQATRNQGNRCNQIARLHAVAANEEEFVSHV